MRVAVDVQGERFDFEVADDRLVGDWHGPPGLEPETVEARVRAALDRPSGYPPLRQAVVPGDRVVIAAEPDLPSLGPVVRVACDVLGDAGVEPEAIQVVVGGPPGPEADLPRGVEWIVHDPDDRAGLAYLASTAQGRRVYLNRHLTDADVVLPIGRLGFDPVLGYCGPWSAIFPGLSDAETQAAYRALASEAPPDPERPRPPLAESVDVSWLLGSQFHLGILAGRSGAAGAIAGSEAEVRRLGARAVDDAWSFTADRRAELVVVGIGGPGRIADLDDLGAGLATAERLVRRGGKIAVLSRVGGSPGPALGRLVGLDDPRAGLAALRGSESQPDFATARRFARALARADVYLWSALDEQQVEDLGMLALGGPAEARHLATLSDSCLFVSQAELARGRVADED